MISVKYKMRIYFNNKKEFQFRAGYINNSTHIQRLPTHQIIETITNDITYSCTSYNPRLFSILFVPNIQDSRSYFKCLSPH